MLPLIIDNIDFTPYTNERAYAVIYEKREGPNSGTAMSGAAILDVVKIKAVITWELNALTADRLAALLNATLRKTVSVTYSDTWINAERTAEFIPTIGQQNYAFERNGVRYFRNGTVLTLRERVGRTPT